MKAWGLMTVALWAFVLLGLGDSMLGVAWPAVRSEFLQPLSALGEVNLVRVAAYLLVSVASGRLAAGLGRGRFLIVSAIAGVLALAGPGLSPSWWLFLASAVFYGLWSGSIDPGLNAWMAGRGDVRAMNLLHFSYGVGASLGPLAVTMAEAHLEGWRTAYLVAGALMLILLVGFTVTRSGWGDGPVLTPSAGGRSSYQLPLLAATLATFFVYTGLEVAAGQWAFSYLVGGGATPALAGVAVTAYWAGLTLARLGLAALGARVRATTLVHTSTGVVLAGAVGFLLLRDTGGAALSLVVLGIGLAGIFPLLVSLTPSRLGAGATNRIVGYQLASANLGASLVPAGIGLGLQGFGVATLPAFLVAAALLFAALELGTARLADAKFAQRL